MIIEEVKTPTFRLPMCNTCARRTGPMSCQAFDEIPEEILQGEELHIEPRKDQGNKYAYLPIEEDND